MSRLLRRVWPLNIRTRMMLWYTLIFAILFLLFAGVFYFNLQTSLETNVDSELQLHAQAIAQGITEENGTISVQDTTGDLPGQTGSENSGVPSPQQTPTTKNANRQSKADVDFGPIVRILYASGKAYYTSPTFQNLALPSIAVTQPLHNMTWTGTVTTNNGKNVRIYSLPLLNNGKVYAIIQVGESLVSLDSTLRNAALELLIIGIFVLLLSFFGSYWLAARSFAPVKKMTSIARHIEAGELHERVPVPGTQDELQTLALTFNEMIERLEKAFARQRRFVSDASHELRTPVAAIRSMTDVALAQSGPVPPGEYITVLQDVNAEAEQMGHLINDLLSLARTDENKVLLEQEPVRLDLLVIDVTATTEPLASEKGITLEVQAEQPAIILGDEVRLIQVIMNLIDNAISYTNSGGKVLLQVEVIGNSAFLRVSDTGIGIEQQHLEHIFERFYRVDPARSRAAGGTGLGLAIVDWIVRAHNGSISVESQVGRGTTFTAQLPLAPHSPS